MNVATARAAMPSTSRPASVRSRRIVRALRLPGAPISGGE